MSDRMFGGGAMRVGVCTASAAFLVATAAVSQGRSAATQATVTDQTISALLDAGRWSETADDTVHGEQLPSAVARGLGASAAAPSRSPEQFGDLGALVLALSVAEWGVEGQSQPPDPAKKGWTGPAMLGGKHVMSYTAGGIGLPHLDAAPAIPFFDELARQVPAAAPEAAEIRAMGPGGRNFRFDRVRAQGGICSNKVPKPTLPNDLMGSPFSTVAEHYDGEQYCKDHGGRARLDPGAWRRLRHWSRVGLRQRGIQDWIVRRWVADNFVPAYDAVMARPGGSLAEAFVIARIRNSSPTLQREALAAAGSETDAARRIASELRTYAAANRHDTNRCRAGVMQRPAALLGLTVIPTDQRGCLPKLRTSQADSSSSSRPNLGRESAAA